MHLLILNNSYSVSYEKRECFTIYHILGRKIKEEEERKEEERKKNRKKGITGMQCGAYYVGY